MASAPRPALHLLSPTPSGPCPPVRAFLTARLAHLAPVFAPSSASASVTTTAPLLPSPARTPSSLVPRLAGTPAMPAAPTVPLPTALTVGDDLAERAAFVDPAVELREWARMYACICEADAALRGQALGLWALPASASGAEGSLCWGMVTPVCRSRGKGGRACL